MAHFYTTVDNSRGNTVSAAGAATGQTAHIRGWDAGIRVDARKVDGDDVFDVFATTGSNGRGRDVLVGTLGNGEWEPRQNAAALIHD